MQLGVARESLTRVLARGPGQQLQQSGECGQLLGAQLPQLHAIARQQGCQPLRCRVCWEPDTELRAVGSQAGGGGMHWQEARSRAGELPSRGMKIFASL